MAYFTESLNSQLSMLGLDNRNEKTPDELSNQLTTISLHQHGEGQRYGQNIQTPPQSSINNGELQLPNDANTLRKMLETRMKYTRPQVGEIWEFNIYTDDIRYLKDCIQFIDNHCQNRYYMEYLSPLEMEPDELDQEFNVRFYNHFSFKVVREELIEQIRLSKYDFLSNLVMFRRSPGDSVPKSWFIYLGNKRLTESDYIRYYDVMDQKMREWILNYCVDNNQIRERAETLKMTTYDLLDVIANGQNLSYQVKLLIDLLNNHEGREDYLSKGFLPYLTYVEHLQESIEKSIPKCENPYKTAFLLMAILKGMAAYPALLNSFEPRLEEFLYTYPNFTLGEVSTFLQKYNMPNLKEFEVKRILN